MMGIASVGMLLVVTALLSLSIFAAEGSTECEGDGACINPDMITDNESSSEYEYSEYGGDGDEYEYSEDEGYGDYYEYSEDEGNGDEPEYSEDEGDGDEPLPTLEQLLDFKSCHKLSTRPLYTEEDWQRVRRIYNDQGIHYNNGVVPDVPDDFVPPTRSGQTTDGKGRGVFASRDIKRGEMTYGGGRNYAFFWDGPSFRKFLDALTDLEACDIMDWAWTQTWKGGNNEPLILLPLDDNSLQNHGNYEDLVNIGCPMEDCGMFNEFALRDIEEGEELLNDYGLFIETDIWKEFGL